MDIVNRGFLSVTPKEAFWNWSNQLNEEGMEFNVEDDIEPTVYLITEDFFDEGPIIEQHFKKIFKNELTVVTDNEEFWPKEITMELFLDWFEIKLGSMVFDLEKSNLVGEKI